MADGITPTQLQNSVCLIQIYDKENEIVRFKGTGFHYGGGWIMTAAHNFQDDSEDTLTTHSILKDARFDVVFEFGEEKYVFERKKRMAFIHHLHPGDEADFKNKDIAMIKLGRQWEYGRCFDDVKYKEELDEQKMLDELMGTDSCFPYPLQAEEGEIVYTAHYGGDGNEKKSETSKVLRITSLTANQVPMLHLEKKKGVLQAGASGCPIMAEREGKYRLVGLHFSGDDDEEDGEAEALSWDKGIQGYIQEGVSIIADIGSYMAYSELALQIQGSTELQNSSINTAQQSRESLLGLASNANLTIYLSNGEVVNQSENGRQLHTGCQQVSFAMYCTIALAVFVFIVILGQYYYFYFLCFVSLISLIICDGNTVCSASNTRDREVATFTDEAGDSEGVFFENFGEVPENFYTHHMEGHFENLVEVF